MTGKILSTTVRNWSRFWKIPMAVLFIRNKLCRLCGIWQDIVMVKVMKYVVPCRRKKQKKWNAIAIFSFMGMKARESTAVSNGESRKRPPEKFMPTWQILPNTPLTNPMRQLMRWFLIKRHIWNIIIPKNLWQPFLLPLWITPEKLRNIPWPAGRWGFRFFPRISTRERQNLPLRRRESAMDLPRLKVWDDLLSRKLWQRGVLPGLTTLWKIYAAVCQENPWISGRWRVLLRRGHWTALREPESKKWVPMLLFWMELVMKRRPRWRGSCHYLILQMKKKKRNLRQNFRMWVNMTRKWFSRLKKRFLAFISVDIRWKIMWMWWRKILPGILQILLRRMVIIFPR